MAEIQFFATERDHESLVAMLVSEYSATFVLDAGALTPLQSMSTVSEVMNAIADAAYGLRFYVLSPTWSREPLAVSEVQRRDGATRFYVKGRYGGPSLDYIANHETESTLGGQIVQSSIAAFASYYLGVGEVPRPTALSGAMAAARRVVTRGGKRTTVQETGKLGPVAMRDARNAQELGNWLRVGEWHHAPRGET